MIKMPCTVEQFFEVFEHYNTTHFPAQIILFFISAYVLFTIYKKESISRWVGYFLGFLWVWVGSIYHSYYFSTINPLGEIFGQLFILQGFVLMGEAYFGKLDFTYNQSLKHKIGLSFVIFGLIIYPIISWSIESSAIRIISLGLPCPTVIFTFGLLMLTGDKFRKYTLIIPLIWAIIGTSAAYYFGVYQDVMLIISAVTAFVFLMRKKTDFIPEKSYS